MKSLVVAALAVALSSGAAPAPPVTSIKTFPYKLREDVPVIDIVSTNGLNPQWRWQQDGDLPLPWPPEYIARKQAFAPYYWFVNIRLIAQAIRTGGDEGTSYRRALPYLMRQLERYTAHDPCGDFVTYEFSYETYGRSIPKGWHSAFASAVVVLGFVDLFEATGDRIWIDRSRPYLDALLTLGHITKIDAERYLWFEEYPEQMHGVFNGHIATILALYHFGKVTGENFDEFIRAGLTTMERYLPLARHPGRVSAYGMFDLSKDDYGPQRIINFTKAIADISQNREIAEIASEFASDMR